MPRKRSKKQNYSVKNDGIENLNITQPKDAATQKLPEKDNFTKSDSIVEDFRKLEICGQEVIEKNDGGATQSNINVPSPSVDQLSKLKLKRSVSTHSVKSEQTWKEYSKKKIKRIRFSRDVRVMKYGTGHVTECHVEPLADENDQQERSYKKKLMHFSTGPWYW